MFNSDLISEKISKAKLFIFGLFYIIITFILLSENGNTALIAYFFVIVILYFIKPSLSFIMAILALIEPIGRVTFGKVAILFIILALIHIPLNFRKYKTLIKEDKIFRLILINAFVFMLYQIFITFSETDGTSFYSYFLKNVRLILGIWVVIPAYYFGLNDRKNFFISILIISVITLFYFYLSNFGIYNFFSVSESDRGMDKDITRLGISGFDFRYLTKFVAYILPAIFLFDVNKGLLRRVLIIDGLMAFGILVLMLLRLDLVYTILGSFLVVYILNRKYGITNKFNKSIKISLIFLFLFVIFFRQFQQVIDTYLLTASSVSGSSSDSSLDTRGDWILLIVPYILKFMILGVGYFTLSYENLDVYAAADMPLFASVAIYGIVGVLIYIWRYIYVYKAFKMVQISRELFHEYKYETIILYGIGCFFITALFFKFYLVFAELIYGWAYIEFSVLLGAFFGLKRFFEIKSEQLNEEIDESYIKEEL